MPRKKSSKTRLREYIKQLDKKKYYYDSEKADRVIKFIEKFCKHKEGALAGKPLLLEDWQKDDIIRPLFGTMKKENGFRRYRTGYVEIPRKNAKSALGSAIGLYLLCGDREPGAQVYAAAAKKDQAKIVFDLSKSMVENSNRLSSSCEILKDSIFHKPSQSIFRVIPADADTSHGFNTHGYVFDELHVQPNRELYDVISTSTGARRQPLGFIITTAGLKNTFAEEMHNYAANIISGKIEDDSFFALIYAADVEDDPFDEKVWIKANPGIGVIVQLEYLQQMAKRAKNMPSFLNNFLRLHLNIWTGAVTSWIADHDWKKCDKGKRTLAEMAGRECWGGLDLASVRDLCSLAMYFPETEEGEDAVMFVWFWCPEETIQERDRNENVKYSEWVRAGLINTIPGNANDFKFIVNFILDLPEDIRLKGIAYDRWNSNDTVTTLLEQGVSMQPYGQGFASMSPPSKMLELMILREEINHQGNPVLAWQMDNVALRYDPAENIKPDKAKSKDKIDGVVAAVMSIGQHVIDTANPDPKSRYEKDNEDFYSLE